MDTVQYLFVPLAWSATFADLHVFVPKEATEYPIPHCFIQYIIVVLQKPLFKLIYMFATSFTSIVVTVAAIVMSQYVDRLALIV